MDTSTIDHLLKHNDTTKSIYIGCFPCNYFPKIEKYPSACVLNLDNNNEAGTHWIAILVKNSFTLYYFDSFGEEANTCIKDMLVKYKNIEYNKIKFQSIFSNVCGQYVIFVIFKFCKGISFHSIIEFLKRLKNPDIYVKTFVLKMVQ